MNIVIGLPPLIGASIGVGIALVVTLCVCFLEDFASLGGISSVGEKMTKEGFREKFRRPAIVLGSIGGLLGLLIGNF